MEKHTGILLLILAISVFGAVFIVPKQFGADVLPWRLGLDLVGGVHLVYEVDMTSVSEADRDSVHEGLRDVIAKRVERGDSLLGVTEAQVVTAKSGDAYRLIVDLPGEKDIDAAVKKIGETPFLYFAEVSTEETGTSTPVDILYTPTELTGRYISRAELVLDQFSGKPVISLVFNDEGATIFENLTERNVGRQLAVFVDDNVITAPVVQEKITGGRAQITGDFTREEASLLVSRFDAGALSAPISRVSQQTIGATLGTDSLKRVVKAGAIGTGLVMLFMLVYYRKFGIFSACALIVYTIITLTIFKLFGITMTLAGVAGFILSIGMAVDANILIFERSKEEMKRGLSAMSAVEEGFKRAWLSIRDSNISTIITSVILYYATTGFIKGFALALLIGVLVSMFSAITVTRTFLRVFIKK
ncbi:MAG: protein translocase subunit SecD [Candidatus Harrisonbacteria bacterium CG10_big_fil_rev_8_21_14_0_10_40_38]|uniref:Protein translocase subunit SecD n=1 Tax=Candidatus Harrisonbacteria bacterium CG10_big_fil_rev_8_21_14_0_10_40_38 TaxID=1974583 RepID=A0A2H0USC6_9BACT|nr:MAG: protein translocase subunit SecD [Candidatus Harrisonbacteria bacterium CG10_big_fil_rev_8_21_14_0_10_40_38]